MATTPPPPDEKTLALIEKMQAVLEGEANNDIAAACSYIIANAVAILAQDRADADWMIKKLGREQRQMLDGCWDQVRAELGRRKLL